MMAKSFVYQARDAKGRRVNGSITAEDEAAAAAHLRKKELFITRLKETRDLKWLKGIIQGWSAISGRDLAIFCRLFATLAGAGISLVNCLGILQHQTEQIRLKRALAEVQKRIKAGEGLSRAMERRKDVFPALMIGMLEAGEAGGGVDRILGHLAKLFAKEHRLQEKLKSALTYPICICALAIAVIFFIVTFVLPNFRRIFAANRLELPPVTRLLLELSAFSQRYCVEIVIAVAVMAVIILLISRLALFKVYRDVFLLGLPFLGSLLRKAETARFSYTLGALLHSGLPLLNALEMARKTVANSCLAEALLAAQKSVRQGGSIALSLAEEKVFPSLAVQMIGVGEECGELEEMLEKISDFYEAEVEESVYRLSVLVEPFLILFLGLVVGGIIWAVVLPLFDFSLNPGR